MTGLMSELLLTVVAFPRTPLTMERAGVAWQRAIVVLPRLLSAVGWKSSVAKQAFLRPVWTVRVLLVVGRQGSCLPLAVVVWKSSVFQQVFLFPVLLVRVLLVVQRLVLPRSHSVACGCL